MSVETLQQWASARKLQEVEFVDGNLKLGDETLSGNEMVTLTTGDNNNSSCQYTLGSIFLQIKDPEQSLMVYRKACKTYGVNDPIKASDKQMVISYFTASEEAAPEETAVEQPVADAAVPPSTEDKKEPTSVEKRPHHHDKKRDRHHESKHREKDRKRSRSKEPEKQKEKKAHKTIDPDKLFSNLSVVVGKREIKAKRDAEQAKLHAALSTEGFHVTPEEIAKYKAENPNSMVHEIPVGDSSSILKAGAGKDLKRILTLYNETMSTKQSNSKKSSSSSGTALQSPAKRAYLIGKRPIIILPKGMTAPITMVNAYDFFAESKFVPRDKMQQLLRTTGQQPKTVFVRSVNARLGGGKVEYELMDNPKSKLHSSKDWERVVAVIALGQSWQMKDWPGPYGNPVELFGRTFGFYVGMEGDKIPTELQGWSVKQARLNRDKRGLDSVTYASFWNGLDEWMTIHRPELLPQPEV
ncbi:RNA pol II accessory factor, Cdc73 family protein [Nitzschia inconspicua]|uniref:RNA pol II accessory factor, Cdc73 family protein n=1 Tax=Nitzschia inconspicua TaxID=303405 RepID=A0A9K3P939_9STRA|nr:RNA pol II accessory factor, Cdc73 family protein [Nitzschia inconspicua]KAG7358194.1 RNA pol II accessory factor, Cdc73 family protein [Nitzschia inconspicua]